LQPYDFYTADVESRILTFRFGPALHLPAHSSE
jgi:hypothetical protein